ncbi:MAG: glutaminase [Gammaproteobacteria bacterium]
MPTDLFLDYLETLHNEHASITQGEVADYIPEFLKADPEWFGIAIVTVDGHVYQVGDTQQAFTIQSISKVITYGIALRLAGLSRIKAPRAACSSK